MKKHNTRLRIKSVKGLGNSIFEVMISSKELLTPPIFKDTPIRFHWIPTSEKFKESIERINNKLINDYVNKIGKSKDLLTKESINYEKNSLLESLLKCKEFLNIVNREPKSIAAIKHVEKVNHQSNIIEVVVENLSTFDVFVRDKEIDVETFPEERKHNYNITRYKNSDAFIKEFKETIISEVDFDLPEDFDLKALFRKIKKEPLPNSKNKTFLFPILLIVSLLLGSAIIWYDFFLKESINPPEPINILPPKNTPATTTNTTVNTDEWFRKREAFLNCLKEATNSESIKESIDRQLVFTRGMSSKSDKLLDDQEQKIIKKIQAKNNIDLKNCLAIR